MQQVVNQTTLFKTTLLSERPHQGHTLFMVLRPGDVVMPELDLKQTIAGETPETDSAERNAHAQSLGCEANTVVILPATIQRYTVTEIHSIAMTAT
ncbi:hypothetical protein OPN73_004404 [Salmonella enterica]|nr:hypothetical protein [Salmonella enterica]